MRPIKLKMSAFGPYAGQQILDFKELKERTFFLIHGPTGSGKTTILDAICFALYGDTSGAFRDGKAMRSDHSELITPTEIEFEFSLGDKSYRIKRWPEQERPKKRGEGVTILSANAVLWQINPDQGILAEGWLDVTKKIEILIGFKSSQFRQVVLLPQGDFKKLLTANSTERQEIMQTLFKTELYKVLEDQLKQRATEVKRTYEQLTKQRTWVLEEASISTKEELEQQADAKQVQLEYLSKEIDALKKKFQDAQELVTNGKLIETKLNEKKQAELALSELEQKIPIVEQYRKEFTRATNALSLIDLETVLVQNSNELKELEKAYSDIILKFSESKEALSKAEITLREEEDKEVLRKNVSDKILYLETISTKLDSLKELDKKLQSLRTSASLAQETHSKIENELKNIKGILETETIHSQTLSELSQKTSLHKNEIERLQVIIQQLTTIANLKETLLKQNKNLDSSLSILTELDSKYNQTKNDLQTLQEKWKNGQASILAQSLLPNQPCPVCGSTHHPLPATLSSKLPSENDLHRQENLINRIEKEQKQQQLHYNKAVVERDTTINRIQDLESSLGDLNQTDISELAKKLKEAQDSYQEGLRAKVEYEALLKRQLELKASEEDLSSKLELADQELQVHVSDLTAHEAIFKDRLSEIPEAYRDINNLLHVLKEAQSYQTVLKEAFNNAQQMVQTKRQQVIQLETTIENLKINIKSKETALSILNNRFKDKLSNSGFISTEDYISAKKDPTFVKKLQERIQSFDNNLSAARERLARAIHNSEGLTMPNLLELYTNLEQAQTNYTASLSKQTSLIEQLKRESAWLETLSKLEDDIKKADESYTLIGRLSEIANGNNEYKLTFQRFVLGALLDDVVIAANERLKTMSRGRYYLQRTMDRARKNAAGGLELEVFDNHTGIARSVNTLSGGETFLASLSLALGLADVVQSYSGGIHLDTIFIDEGFGTLDPETLDFAIKALLDLQKGGRLVGIISHVPELKERIDARLEIKSTLKGSSAAFKIG